MAKTPHHAPPCLRFPSAMMATCRLVPSRPSVVAFRRAKARSDQIRSVRRLGNPSLHRRAPSMETARRRRTSRVAPQRACRVAALGAPLRCLLCRCAFAPCQSWRSATRPSLRNVPVPCLETQMVVGAPPSLHRGPPASYAFTMDRALHFLVLSSFGRPPASLLPAPAAPCAARSGGRSEEGV